MKPISELLRIIQSIDAVDLAEYKYNLDKHFYHLAGVVQNADYHSDEVVHTITDSYKIAAREHINTRKALEVYKDFLKKEIKKMEVDYYVKSEEIYYDSRHDTPKYILKRRKLSLSLKNEEIREIFFSRVSHYNRWQYPAIEIRPAFGQITDIIKGCDPLYLVDTDEKLLDNVKTRWTPTYQRRLRYYTINETNKNLFHALPDNQYGFVVSVDFFNYKTINIINNYLLEIFQKLRPGGTFMFNYNNCDLPYAARNVENNFCCYTPGHKLVELAKNAGFEITRQEDQFENISWLELKKPGELTSIKGGQTLGEILSFSHVTKKQPPEPKPDPDSPGEKWAAQNGSRLLRPK